MPEQGRFINKLLYNASVTSQTCHHHNHPHNPHHHQHPHHYNCCCDYYHPQQHHNHHHYFIIVIVIIIIIIIIILLSSSSSSSFSYFFDWFFYNYNYGYLFCNYVLLQGYLYAATQNGRECTCGNTLNNPTYAKWNDCKSVCAKGEADVCGGNYFSSLYEKVE